LNLKFWSELPWDIRVKTYLTMYAVEIEARNDSDLSEREVNILRWAALLLHIGCAKKSKTSKLYIYSFLSALFIIQMLECDHVAQELLEGSGYQQMQLQTVSRAPILHEVDNFVNVERSRTTLT